MDAAAKVREVILRVDSDDVTLRQCCDQFDFVRVVCEDFQRFRAAHFTSDDRIVRLHDVHHFRFDFRQVLFGKLHFHIGIIIETSFDRWSYTKMDFREQARQGMRHQVGSRVTQDTQSVCVIRCHDFKRSIRLQRTGEVDQFPVEFSGQSFFG